MLKLKIRSHGSKRSQWVQVVHEGEELWVSAEGSNNNTWLLFHGPLSFKMLREKLVEEQE